MTGLNESVWFAAFAAIALKSTAVLVVAFTAAFLLRHSSAAVRHNVWTAAAAALLCLPFLSMALPSLPAPGARALLPDFQSTAQATSSTTDVSASGEAVRPIPRRPETWQVNWRKLAIAVWLLGTAFTLAQMLFAWAGVWRLRRSAAPSPDQRLGDELARKLAISTRVDVVETAAGTMPMTFGLLRPAVLMPSDARSWSDERRRAVLLHELAHVRRGDGGTILLARLAFILNWWNPLAWIAWRRLLTESERAADDFVLNAGTRAAEYAGHLLDVARHMRDVRLGWAAMPMARRSQLESRLRAILDSTAKRNTAGRASAIAAALIGAVVVIPLAAVRAQDTAPQPGSADVDATIQAATAQRNFQVLDQRAAALILRGDYDNARKLLDASVALRQQASTIDYGLGLVALGDLETKRGHFADAEAYYSKAATTLGDNPEASRALLKLGIAALHAKDLERAMGYFQSAQRVNPADAGPAWMWMALVRERERNPEEAGAMYRSALAVEGQDSPDAATTMELYARLLSELGRDAEAQPLIDRARTLRNAHSAKQVSPGAYKMSDDITKPHLISKVEPQYTEEARLAKYQGTAVLSVEIGADGVPHNVQVIRGLGLGLDDNAVAAVSTWRFQPGMKDGAAAPVLATIEVNFRLM